MPKDISSTISDLNRLLINGKVGELLLTNNCLIEFCKNKHCERIHFDNFLHNYLKLDKTQWKPIIAHIDEKSESMKIFNEEVYQVLKILALQLTYFDDVKLLNKNYKDVSFQFRTNILNKFTHRVSQLNIYIELFNSEPLILEMLQNIIGEQISIKDQSHNMLGFEDTFNDQKLIYEDCTFDHFAIQNKYFNYLLTECPKNIYEVGDLFTYCLENDIEAMVSVIPLLEYYPKVKSNFWLNLINIPLRYGWYFNPLDNEVFNEVTIKSQVHKKIALKKQVFIFTKHDGSKKYITHFHFDNWPDAKQCPDQTLLYTLLNSLNTKKPIQINCRHGKGRSGTVLACHLMRQIIDEQDDPIINIPYMIYLLRRQRSGFVKHAKQIKDIYELTYRYYSNKKRVLNMLKQYFNEKLATLIFKGASPL